MKGLISYSSRTGNTEKLAKTLQRMLTENGDTWDLCPVSEAKWDDSYDVLLHGIWVNRTDLDSDSKKFLKSLPKGLRMGIFGTSGGEHMSEYGMRLQNHLKEAVEPFEHIGTKLTYGKVDPQMKDKVDGILGVLVPKKIKEHILEMVEKSREATEEEREDVARYFLERL